MHYRIAAGSTIYRGEFKPMGGEPPVLTALVQQFGTPGILATICLVHWSNDQVSYWADNLFDDPRTSSFRCVVDGVSHEVRVADGPIE